MSACDADVIGIGTSPLMLIRAIRLAEAGERVLLVDRARVVGGGWAAPPIMGLERVEAGVHLLENRPALVRFFEVELGVRLDVDPCGSIVRGRSLPMAVTRAGFHAAVAAKALFRGEPDKARRGLRSGWRSAVDAHRRYYYPSEGAWTLLAALLSRFQGLGGVVRHGVEIRGVEAGGSGVICSTTAGDLHARRALIGSRAWAPITIDGEPLELQVEQGICWNAVLRLSGCGGPPVSYLEIVGDPLLKRVRDVGTFSRPKISGDERLLVVQYRQDQGLEDGTLATTLAERLVRLGLLERPGRVIGIARTDMPLATLTDATLERISRRSSGRIETLSTADLADGFVSAQKRLTAVGRGDRRQPPVTRPLAPS